MTLIVKPLKGYLTHNTNFFTSMDPYCYLYLGKQGHKTSPHFGGGIRPTWREVLKFTLDHITKLGVEIWAKALIGNDTLIGQGLIDIKKINMGKGESIQEYVDILFENKPAGRVLLELQFVPSQLVQNKTPGIPAKQNVQNQKKTQRNSWAGEINWKGSNADDKLQQFQSSSAIYQNQIKEQIKVNTPTFDNTYGFTEAGMANFKKKQGNAQHGSDQINKTQQEKANQYLNQQLLKNFAPKQSNAGSNTNAPPLQKQQQNHQNRQISAQQALQHQKLHQQQIYQQQMMQQYPMLQSPFQNLNNLKPSTGLTPGTIYAQPDRNYNPNRKSNAGRGSNVGIGNTPPKSILSPHNKGKSPGKKVHFQDQKI